jgi:uncharacterized protein YbjQ (UPF0145 family)
VDGALHALAAITAAASAAYVLRATPRITPRIPHSSARLAMPLRTLPEFTATTSNALDGFETVHTYGVVRGIVVRSRGFVGRIGVGLQTIFGGNISLLTEMCDRARSDAFEIMTEHARALGANAIIAVRYDATEIMSGISEVLCYGTAVRVAPRLSAGENAGD